MPPSRRGLACMPNRLDAFIGVKPLIYKGSPIEAFFWANNLQYLGSENAILAVKAIVEKPTFLKFVFL